MSSAKSKLLLLQAAQMPLPAKAAAGKAASLLAATMASLPPTATPTTGKATKAVKLVKGGKGGALMAASKAPLSGPATPSSSPKMQWERRPRRRDDAVATIAGLRHEQRLPEDEKVRQIRRHLAYLNGMPGAASKFEQSRRADIRYARDLVAFTAASATAYGRQPRKKNLRAPAKQWSAYLTHRHVQRLKRGGKPPKSGMELFEARRVADGLDMYFKKHALRSPQMPPGSEFTNGRSRYLYRGIRDRPAGLVSDALKTGVYRESGYVATSRSRDVGKKFSQGPGPQDEGLVFRIDVFRGIPRGTPWAWYSGAGTAVAQHRNFQRGVAGEKEVLLPPGELRVVGRPFDDNGALTVDAVYVPDPKYAFKPRRRGSAADGDGYSLPSLF